METNIVEIAVVLVTAYVIFQFYGMRVQHNLNKQALQFIEKVIVQAYKGDTEYLEEADKFYGDNKNKLSPRISASLLHSIKIAKAL
jgi:uncharacterized membrane protein